MTTTPRLALAALVLALAAPAAAAAAEDRPRVGIGVGLSTFDVNLTMLANDFPAQVPDSIYVPINVSSRLRVEPQVGVARLDQSAGNNPSIETTVVSVGVGVLWLVPVSGELDLHVGARVVRTSYRSRLKFDPPRGAQTTDGADVRLIPAVGGEYALHPRFTLGAEAQLQLVSFGDRTISSGGTLPGGTGISTAGVLFARVYLF